MKITVGWHERAGGGWRWSIHDGGETIAESVAYKSRTEAAQAANRVVKAISQKGVVLPRETEA